MPLQQPNCPVCGSAKRRALPVLHHWGGARWSLIRCRSCKHRYTDPVPDETELSCWYDDTYFSAAGAWVCGFWPGSYVENERNLRAEAQETLAILPRTGGRLLEVGCAGGIFLDEARKAGFTPHGIELNRHMADWGSANLGLDIQCGSFETAQFERDAFDLVVAQDVLEHVRDPVAFVARVRDVLSSGGSFLFRGPLEDSFRLSIYYALRRVPGRGPRLEYEPPYHLQGYGRKSFRRLIGSAGLTLRALSVVPVKPVRSFRRPKAVAQSVLETTAYHLDRISGRGEFMVAQGRKAP